MTEEQHPYTVRHVLGVLGQEFRYLEKEEDGVRIYFDRRNAPPSDVPAENILIPNSALNSSSDAADFGSLVGYRLFGQIPQY